MKIIETGKYKGKTLIECPKEYLEWASKHEKNFAKRNQWIARDARFILARMAEGKVFEPILKEWVTLPNDNDVLNVEKELGSWGYIRRQAKNRELAQMRNEMRGIRRHRRLDNIAQGFSILR